MYGMQKNILKRILNFFKLNTVSENSDLFNPKSIILNFGTISMKDNLDYLSLKI